MRSIVIVALLALTSSAWAQTCPAPRMFPCYTLRYLYQCGVQPRPAPPGSGANPNLCSGGGYCEPEEDDYAAGTACTDDGNPCTTDTCDGAGTCDHTNSTGGVACGASCIPAGTCCDNTSCSGGMVCSTPGGSCACPSGTTNCNGTCIANGTCCSNADCTSGGHVCSGSGGSCVCPSGQYDCQGTCIGNTTCCTSPSTCSAATSRSTRSTVWPTRT